MKLALFLALLATGTEAKEQNLWTEFRKAFNRVLIAPDYVRSARAARFYDSLLAAQRIPFVTTDSVMFLFMGEANRVAWFGDFNEWGQRDAALYTGKRVPGTSLWYLAAHFDSDARLDYKIVLNGNTWMLDPANPHQQWSGVGGGSPNSELRMPGWKPDTLTRHPLTSRHGKLIEEQLFYSSLLGYQISYSVYLPYGFKPVNRYPVLYVTDGYEYAHEKLGNITNTLDNLIARGAISEIIVVLIDHREPANRSNNRRMHELAMNKQYLTFLTEEFIPFIESKWPVTASRHERGLLGTSMGGLAALYMAYAKPDLFGLAAAQSPAFWFKPEIFTFCQTASAMPVKIYLSCGTVFDGEENTRKMKAILENQRCPLMYLETHQGHSWGNWRDQLDDILIFFFKPD